MNKIDQFLEVLKSFDAFYCQKCKCELSYKEILFTHLYLLCMEDMEILKRFAKEVNNGDQSIFCNKCKKELFIIKESNKCINIPSSIIRDNTGQVIYYKYPWLDDPNYKKRYENWNTKRAGKSGLTQFLKRLKNKV